MTDDARLLAALAVIQARGAIGERSLTEAVAHADRFVALVPTGATSLIDLGSGGGLPALVIAWRRPELMVTMVERRATRADLLRRATTSLGLGEHTTVRAVDVALVCAESPSAFDVVTARSFGDVVTTADIISQLVAVPGIALISEPPTDRAGVWAAALCNHPALVDDGIYQGIRRLKCVANRARRST